MSEDDIKKLEAFLEECPEVKEFIDIMLETLTKALQPLFEAMNNLDLNKVRELLKSEGKKGE